MASGATHWNLEVTAETDAELREFLNIWGQGERRDLSSFVEDAVRARIFELSVQQAKRENKDFSEAEIESAVDEAVSWARRP